MSYACSTVLPCPPPTLRLLTPQREKAYPYPYSAPSHPSHPSYSRLGSSSSSLRNSDLIPSLIIGTALTLGAFIVRFWRISHPDQVVFDEVHFGSFAGHYIRREYYFDVHPPLAKMLNAAAAWVVGFDGVFGFENIGDSYTAAAVSRNLPAWGDR